jgi:hypothetical protein
MPLQVQVQVPVVRLPLPRRHRSALQQLLPVTMKR